MLVEDAGELRPAHPHVVRLRGARRPTSRAPGAVDLRDLVRQALRMRPDRLVVGEVRGAEVVELLAALNTGHDGGCRHRARHAGRGVPARLEALALAAGLPREALHSQLAAGVQVVVHLARTPGGGRLVREVGCVARGPDGLSRVVPAITADDAGRLVAGAAASSLTTLLTGRAAVTGGWTLRRWPWSWPAAAGAAVPVDRSAQLRRLRPAPSAAHHRPSIAVRWWAPVPVVATAPGGGAGRSCSARGGRAGGVGGVCGRCRHGPRGAGQTVAVPRRSTCWPRSLPSCAAAPSHGRRSPPRPAAAPGRSPRPPAARRPTRRGAGGG